MPSIDHAAEIRRLDTMATWLDSRFRIPGTDLRFGLDALLGLLPGVGDTVTALPGIYLIFRSRRLGLPWHVQVRMVANLGIDLAVGAIPLVGDLFDLGFKSNRRNMEVLKRHLQRRAHHERSGEQAVIIDQPATEIESTEASREA